MVLNYGAPARKSQNLFIGEAKGVPGQFNEILDFSKGEKYNTIPLPIASFCWIVDGSF